MFDIGMLELMVIGIVALIVIGPKDLPGLFHNLGRMTARLRGMAREFSSAMEDAAKQSGADDIARDLNAIANPRKTVTNSLKEAADKFDDWDPMNTPRNPVPERGAHTEALREERAEAARKIHEASLKKSAVDVDKADGGEPAPEPKQAD